MDDLISKEQAIDKIKKRLFETAFNNIGIKQNVDETLVDVAEDRLENWFDELPSVHPDTTAYGSNVVKKGGNDEDKTTDDSISRQQAIDALRAMQTYKMFVGDDLLLIDQAGAQTELMMLPPAQPEPHEIGYSECANAMLKMWIDNVLTDGEYNRIMDKLNAHWAERREE